MLYAALKMAWLDVRQARAATRVLVIALGVSGALHVLLVLLMRGDGATEDEGMRLSLPSQVELGVTEPELGGEPAPGPAPPPAAKAAPKRAANKPVAPKPETADIMLPRDAGTLADAGTIADAEVADAEVAGNSDGVDGGELAAVSGDGVFAGADGTGGFGPGGDGTAYAPEGATIALNVDIERVRSTALLLEARALLGIIPEWELLLQGSGIDPVKDLSRVFVATPNLMRASVVVSARAERGKEGIEAAVQRLASERGKPASWRADKGFPVAPWHNRGPTERVLARVADDQLVITRAQDLGRVLAIARALQKGRAREGFSKQELKRSGGLLAMQDDEAAALWVEGVRTYVPNAVSGVPTALRFSIRRIDQFHTELRAAGRYGSDAEATDALGFIDGLRKEWSTHPRVIFLGLKNALDTAVIEQDGRQLVLRVALTLHQTRYLLAFVSKTLSPRDATAPR